MAPVSAVRVMSTIPMLEGLLDSRSCTKVLLLLLPTVTALFVTTPLLRDAERMVVPPPRRLVPCRITMVPL